jgi:hypothetical protein
MICAEAGAVRQSAASANGKNRFIYLFRAKFVVGGIASQRICARALVGRR